MEASVELQLLGAAIVVGIVQLVWAAATARGQQNLQWAAGSRDEPMPPLTGVAGRLDRAFRNYMETFPLVAAALLAAVVAQKTGPLTLWGAGLYVAARALYVPIYAAGIRLVRTLVWFVAIVGLLMVLVALFR
jgi:uncharacterized MAPEG superfamily protein